MFSCIFCGENFREKSDLEPHEETVWCDECQEEWDCKNHNVPIWCDECDLRWNCDIKHEIHMQQKHELECDIYRKSKPETKGDETSAEGDQTVADTLFEGLLKLIM